MATKSSSTKQPININILGIEEVQFTIKGESPLIVHKWSEKAKKEIRDKQTGVAKKTKHDIRIPTNDFIDSMYWLSVEPRHGTNDDDAWENFAKAVQDGAHFGFPLVGIKSSIISGAARGGLDVKMTELRGTFFLTSPYRNDNYHEYAEIISDVPVMREDMVMVGGMSKSADLRYRAEFRNWHCDLIMRYNKNGKYSIEQILNCVNYGGFVTGIGEWRPEKDGQFGMYSLVI